MLYLRIADRAQLSSLRTFMTTVFARTSLSEDAGVLGVELPGSPTAQHERREIIGYITTWQALCQGCHVEVLEQQQQQ